MRQPEITITFTELGASAIKRGERGIIAMILKSDTNEGPFSFDKSTEIPSSYEEALATQLKLAFKGYVNPPRRVLGFILPATDFHYTAVTPNTGDDPYASGWYEESAGEYFASSDAVAKNGVTYYEKAYTEVTPEEGADPSANGWYELVDEAYVISTDTEASEGKTYYSLSYTQVATVNYADNPSTSTWYELSGGAYTLSTDTYPVTGKTYYTKSARRQATKDYTAAYDYLKGVNFQYLVVPTVATDNMTSSVVSFIKEQRADGNLIKAVLPDTPGDNEGIINVTTASFTTEDGTFTAEQYCSRIAGLIAGTPLTMSATYAPLTECTDCARLSRSQADAAADAGQFVALWDGKKVKMGRAINSLVTTSQGKNTQFQKIKIVDAMDMITDDIKTTCEDSYIGKYANTYGNKLTLLTAISGYFDGLVKDYVIAGYSIDIDVDANELYLKQKGIDTSEMSRKELRMANTGSYVFLVATLSMVDAIEDIVLNITI